MASRLFAAIDVGSFELELGIYEVTAKNKIRKIDEVRHVIALGSETYNTGKISYEMVEELSQVLGDFARIMKSYRITDYRAYATSAMREARNSQLVIEQIRVRTGIEIKIISNSELRFLGYKAIAAMGEEFDKNIRKGTAIVDVGFGSSQVSLFDEGLLVSTANLPLGVLRIHTILQDVHTTVDRTADLINEMIGHELEQYHKRYLEKHSVKYLIAVGDLILFLFRFTDNGKRQSKVSRSQFNELYEKLSRMTAGQIEEEFELSAEYAAVLLPAASIFRKFLEMTGAEEIWIPGVRLCDGIAAEFYADHKMLNLKHDFEEDIISASRNMAKRYRSKTAHTELVESYALKIFDTIRKFHGMGARERLLLRIAAIVHGCGRFISVRNASECAYNIIMSTEIIGLSHLEREVVANVVRYLSKDFDYNDIQMEAEAFGCGNAKDVTILIAKLTAILRLADSMDLAHKHAMKDCRMSVREDELVVTVDYRGDLTLDTISFEQHTVFFEEIFGICPVLKRKRSV